MEKVRVRYAPSPTGHLHIGGARSALFNYLYAKHNKGTFIIRIEDTDIKRNIENGEEDQIFNLEWLGIIADESPKKVNPKYGNYRQSERIEIYQKYANQLLLKNSAYRCFCSEEKLELSRLEQNKRNIFSPRYDRSCANLTIEQIENNLKNKLPFTIRLRATDNLELKWEDIVRGPIIINANDFGDYVIIKTNGIATYNFAVAIDDYLMEITHVLRGEEHISNTPKQLMVYKHFNWKEPQFGHLTLIVDKEKKKLSKRNETTVQFISQFRDKGYLANSLFNFFALLGWSPKTNQEIFEKEELIKQFDFNRFSKAPSYFDIDKLNWINSAYIKQMTDEEYFHYFSKWVLNFYKISDLNRLKSILLLYKNQIQYGEQLIELVKPFYMPNSKLTLEVKQFINPKINQLLLKKLEEIKVWNEDEIDDFLKQISNELKLKGKELFMPIRIIVLGQLHGPSLKSTIFLIGKDQIIKNIKNWG